MRTENKIINKNINFTQIENCILRNPKISNNARLLYGLLVSYSFGTGSCFPGQTRLAIQLRVSTREIRDLLCELKGWGLISWSMREFEKFDAYGRNFVKTNTYTIEKIPGFIIREFIKEEKELLTEIRSNGGYGQPTKEEAQKKRKELKELQNRMIKKGRMGTNQLQ